ALFFILTASIPRDPALLGLVVLCVFLFSFMFNVGIDPYVALLADSIPSEHRGKVSGVTAVFGFFGQVAILLAASALWEKHPDWVLYIVAIGLIIGFAIVAAGVREHRQLAGAPDRAAETGGGRGRRGARGYLRSRWNEEREASKLLGVRVVFQFGINAALPYLTLFVSSEIGTRGWPELVRGLPLVSGLAGMDAAGLSQLVAALLLLFTMVFALPAGWLGDRFGKKRVFGLGLLIMAISGLFAAFATTIPQLILFLVFLAFGNAAQTILFFPYLSDLVPAGRIGEFQGLSATAETGGVVLSVLVAGALIDLNLFNLHYRMIFILTALFLLLGVIALLFVKPRLEPAVTLVPEFSQVDG
ncbi:MAG: MFS transporter, partial [Rudaea sp.]